MKHIYLIGITFFLLVILAVAKTVEIVDFLNSITGKLILCIIIMAYMNIHIFAGLLILLVVAVYYKMYMFDTSGYLSGIDAVYWINLDRSTARREKMEELFHDSAFTGIPIMRISATDGKQAAVFDKIQGTNSENTKIEYACLLSHLESIREFSKSNYNVALIMEDDCTLEYKKYWKQSVQSVINNAPKDWEIIQLCYNTQTPLLSEYTLNNYGNMDSYGGIACMSAYIINRRAAKKFMGNTYNKTTHKYMLRDAHTHEADHYLYKCIRTYTYKYPFFIYSDDNDSTLHPEDLPSHIRSKQLIDKMYKSRIV